MSKKERIYEAALVLFCRFGLQKVNMQEIADAAGVSKKTLYNHFEGKDELFNLTIHWHVEEIVQFYEELSENSKLSTAEKLIKAVAYASQELSLKHSLVYEDMKRMNPYINQPPIKYIQKNIQRAIGRLIDQAKEEGLCRLDYSTSKLTIVLFTMISGLLSWEEVDEMPLQPQELFEAAITLVFDSLLTEKGRELLPIAEMTHNSLA